MFSRLFGTMGEIIKLVIVTLIIVVPIRTYIAQPFIVSGASMYPTFNDREYLIVDELSYLLRSPARGEVIIFRYPKDPNKFFIKRIIGLPGETIKVQNSQVTIVSAQGTELTLTEPYLNGLNYVANSQIELGPAEYFVMGDNRQVSYDSRNWGALPDELITGRALLRLFPPQRAALLPGNVAN